MEYNAARLKDAIIQLIIDAGIIRSGDDVDATSVAFQVLNGDGSTRRFFRVSLSGRPLCIAVLPGAYSVKEMAECHSALAIGNHLQASGIPVPDIIGADPSCGLILFEDLGDMRLHEQMLQDRQRGMELYQQAVKMLARMQVAGAEGFDQNWCYDSPMYDKKTMVERESGYFIKALWQDTLSEKIPDGLVADTERLADQAREYFQPLFLHRDYQSRNIMITNDKVYIIDFQAGRLGPPGYDIASLLIDPYVALSDDEQEHLFAIYIKEMMRFPQVDITLIKQSYPYLAVHRNLQIIGAFSFLSGSNGKSFFKPYILPSLLMLKRRLAADVFNCVPVLRKTVSQAIVTYQSDFRV
jgi:hypothetical protein